MNKNKQALVIGSVLISATGVAHAAQPVTFKSSYTGQVDYTIIGNTQSYSEDRSNCMQKPNSSANLNLPAGSKIVKATLYWSGTGALDSQVRLNGADVTATQTDGSVVAGMNFYQASADVTNLVNETGMTYTFDGQTWTSGDPYCWMNSAYGGWSLVVVYENATLPMNNLINIYQGFQPTPYPVNGRSSIVLGNLPGSCPRTARLTHVSWEGDAYKTEDLYINGQFMGGNTYNGSTAPNLDIDNYNNIALAAGASSISFDTDAFLTYTIWGNAYELTYNNVVAVKTTDCNIPAELPKPDLVVTSIEYTNGIFTSIVKNQGNAATPAGKVIGVGYSVDGVYKTWGAVSAPLAAGQSVIIKTNGAPYNIPEGNHTITGYADDINRIVESVETNNKLSKDIVVQPTSPTEFPDLIVTNVTYKDGVYTSTIKNQGTISTPAGVNIGVGYSVNGAYKTWGAIKGPLAAGQSVTIGTNGGNYVLPVTSASTKVTAYVDDINRIVESLETNNTLSIFVDDKGTTVPAN